MKALQEECLLYQDPAASAEAAGLRYISDETPGFRRKRWGRGFTYFDPEGNRVEDPKLRARLESLVIPPAWAEVWISPDPEGHIQVTGRDSEGRKQYIYHPRWEEIRNLTKFNRMIIFGESLPVIRKKVDEDLRQHKLSRQKVVALVIRLLEETLIRIGNIEYARQNDSYGLTTLQDDNLEVSGSVLHFNFRGKHGIEHDIEIHNRRLARFVKRCQELPGQELFQYLDEAGQSQPISSHDVNDYLRTITEHDFTAKDFRTWGGTVRAVAELYQLGPEEGEKARKKKITQAIKTVAETLGNTPSVCRNYYVHPKIVEAYENQNLCTIMADTVASFVPEPHSLTAEEKAVLRLLKESLPR